MAQFQPPKPERYRVWWVPQISMPAFEYEVPDLATARVLTDVLARYDLFQFENRVKGDYANVGGIQRWDEDEQAWEDLGDDEVLDEWAKEEVHRRWPNYKFEDMGGS